MAPRPVSPAIFAREATRRLIDTAELASLLGLKRRQSVWERVRVGTLPPPLVKLEGAFALWDRDALDLPTDRKES